MSFKIVKKCDICGIEIDPDKKQHWSICIEHIEIDFSKHAGCQTKPFIGDACSQCSQKMSDMISSFVVNSKAEYISNKKQK